MDVWIESAAGALIDASTITVISVSENTQRSEWDVTVHFGSASAVFASRLPDRKSARTVRNALALLPAEGRKKAKPQLIAFEPVTGTATIEDLT